MTVIWRLVKKRHAEVSDAFDGDGARRYGGRWNLSGTRMVYTAQSLSLTALEQFVHLGPEDNHIQFVSFRVEIPEDLSIDKLGPDKLPADWRMEPPPDSTRRIGTQWAESGSSAVLRLPSIIIPTEYNYALNPTHPDFRRLRIEEPKPFSFDSRMWK